MSFKIMIITSLLIFCLLIYLPEVNGNQDAKRLYEDLFRNYNLLIRPVENASDFISVKLGLKLIKIIKLDLKSQYLMTNMWVKHEWTDSNLKWNPSDYGDLKQLYIPADKIWLPDICLINNADDAYQAAIKTKAIIYYDGTVMWQSPVTLKSNCEIDLKYYPLDEQLCNLKFGSWTYGSMINLKHYHFRSAFTDPGIDLSDYYLNMEWDIMSVKALERKQQIYSNETYSEIFFTIRLRRKTLFYTFNLLIPCISLSFCSVFVFYLPTNSREKVSLTISVLISLTFLLLIFVDTMPSTSICLPLLGKYLIFILVLVFSSNLVTYFIINVHFRSPSTHVMSPWFKKLFLKTLPPYLLISLPNEKSSKTIKNSNNPKLFNAFKNAQNLNNLKSSLDSESEHTTKSFTSSLQKLQSPIEGYVYPAEVNRAIRNSLFIAYHLDKEEAYENCKRDWQAIALVLDRLFFYLFFIVCLTGTAGIFLQAPVLYDTSFPIDVQQSMIGKENHLESILHTF